MEFAYIISMMTSKETKGKGEKEMTEAPNSNVRTATDRNGKTITVGSEVAFKIDKEGRGTVTELIEFEGWQGTQVDVRIDTGLDSMHGSEVVLDASEIRVIG